MKSHITPLDRLDYSLRWATEHFFGEGLRLREKAHQRIVGKLCRNASPSIPFQQVPRVGKISRKEFIQSWYSPYSILKSSAMQGLLTLLATNPSVLAARGNGGQFSRIFAMTKNKK